MTKELKLLDVVALLKAMPEEKLQEGQVGTIVEILDENVYEVEFTDRQGQTLTTCAVNSADLLQLQYELEFA
ncbi:MAG: DUF4926 domain-containing protein [Saprospiraceae bacterium]|nr:DUF4926 domain-containing protein [Saprospiraceae bacterium]